MSDGAILRVVQSAMGDAGVLEYPVVARLSRLDARTVRSVGEGTPVETLRAIATGLGGKLVIKIEIPETQ